MRWRRAALAMGCGACDVVLKRGDPYLEITVGKRALPRCPRCAAGEPQPEEELPPLPDPVPLKPTALAPRVKPTLTQIDWKQIAAGGGREPGEEG